MARRHRSSWHLPAALRDILVVRGRDALPAERLRALLGRSVSLKIDGWMREHVTRARLHRIYREALSTGDADDAQVARRLKAAFEGGGLVALSLNRVVVAEARELTADDLLPPFVVQVAVATWIEIELLDLDGQPIPNVNFELVLPDGAVHTGRLDVAGQARVDGIDPGNCKLTFPGTNLCVE